MEGEGEDSGDHGGADLVGEKAEVDFGRAHEDDGHVDLGGGGGELDGEQELGLGEAEEGGRHVVAGLVAGHALHEEAAGRLNAEHKRLGSRHRLPGQRCKV